MSNPDPRQPLRIGTKKDTVSVIEFLGSSAYRLYYKTQDYQGKAGFLAELYPKDLAEEKKLTRNLLTQQLQEQELLVPYLSRLQQYSCFFPKDMEKNGSYILDETGELCCSFTTLFNDRNDNGKIKAFPTLKTVIALLLQCLVPLTKIHEEGYIHGEVTPDNLYYTKDGVVVGDHLSVFPQGCWLQRLPPKKHPYLPTELYHPQQQHLIGVGSDLYGILSIFFSILYGVPFQLIAHITRKKGGAKNGKDLWQLSPILSSPYLQHQQEGVAKAVEQILYQGLKHRYPNITKLQEDLCNLYRLL